MSLLLKNMCVYNVVLYTCVCEILKSRVKLSMISIEKIPFGPHIQYEHLSLLLIPQEKFLPKSITRRAGND